ncbi:MAG TPA: ABC transporter permease [Gemmatimonadales bacterium]|jgi:ABC-2 type transport system permease protein|nr:ABC transporter permease [Gemmatimonadales bacterium]
MTGIRRLLDSSLWPMLRKEFRQMSRDRFTVAMLVGLPSIQLLLFGYAVRTEVRHVPMVVVDHSGTQESRALVTLLTNTQNFDVAGQVSGQAEADDLLARGAVKAAVVIPPDFARDYKRGRKASAQVLVDAVDPLAASAAISAAGLASGTDLESITRGVPAGESGLEIQVRPRYNPGLVSAYNIVPGLIGVLLTLTLVAVTSMALVRERERGTLEQLIVTPVTRSAVILGKILPFVLVGYVQMTVILLLGHLVLDVPLRGNLLLLYLLTLPFIVAVLGVGLLISTGVKTQTQAMQLSIFYLLPSILLTGFMFPPEAMPLLCQLLGKLLPMTYYLEIVRGIALKGSGLTHLWEPAAILTAFALLLVTVSVKRFTKTME